MFHHRRKQKTYPFVAGAQAQEAYMVAYRALHVPASGFPIPLYAGLRHQVRQSMEYLSQFLGQEGTAAARESYLSLFESRAEFGGPIDSNQRLQEKLQAAEQVSSANFALLADVSDRLPSAQLPSFFCGTHMASFNFNARLALLSDLVFSDRMRNSFVELMRRGQPQLEQWLHLYGDSPGVHAEARTAVSQVLATLTDNAILAENAVRQILETTDAALSSYHYQSISKLIATELSAMYDPGSIRWTVDNSDRIPIGLIEESDLRHKRYWRTLALEDLEAALDLAAKAVRTAAPDSPVFAMCLCDLAGCIHERFNRSGKATDLDASISLGWQALGSTNSRHATQRSMASNVGLGLSTRYNYSGDKLDLDAAIDLLHQAAEDTWTASELESPQSIPTSLWEIIAPRRLIWQTNYANALLARYLQHGQDASDLERAIDCFRLIVDATPAKSPDLAIHRQNLANALLDRYRLKSIASDLEQAIELNRVALKEAGPRDRGACLCGLANALVLLSQVDNRLAIADEIRACYLEGIQHIKLSSSGNAIKNAVAWGNWAFGREYWAQAVEAYDQALLLGEELFRLQIGRDAKEAWLEPLRGVVAARTYAAVRCNAESAALKDALVILDTGLSRLLAEKLRAASGELHRLFDVGRGDLVRRYEETAARIALVSNPAGSGEAGGPAGVEAVDALTRASTPVDKLRSELDEIVREIRTVPGYSSFLSAASFDDIAERAEQTAIAWLIPTRQGGLALSVAKGATEVTCLELSDLTEQWVTSAVARLIRVAGLVKQGKAELGKFTADIEQLTIELGTRLADLFRFPPIKTGLVVVPVGLLGFLPVHAAKLGTRHAIDVCPVTYAPTALALTVAPPLPSKTSVLAVATPEAGLPFTADEVQALAGHYGEGAELLVGREHSTMDRVLSKAPDQSILHFSCHASADVLDPLNSALLLGDGRLTLERLLRVRLPHTDLVVLSACESGVPGVRVPEETVNLPSALLQAGVRSVVSTMWFVGDASAAMLIIRFYHLWRVSRLDRILALTSAQAWVRDSTNGEKLAFFTERRALHLIVYLSGRDPKAREHESAWHWAGFNWVGSL